MNPDSIGVVIPAFNSASVLNRCLRSLGELGGGEVVVVDNASTDHTAEKAHSHGVRVVRMEGNLGFAAACNRGVASLEGAHGWLAFVNPDVRIDGAALIAMATDAPAEALALTPLVVDEDGRPQPDIARREPSLAATVGRYLFTARFERAARAYMQGLGRPGPRHLPVEVTSGGCLLVRRSAFDAVGGFSEAYFLNFEDVELCLALRRLGGTIVVDRNLTALHLKGTSSAGVTAEQRMLECARAEMIFFERNHRWWRTLIACWAIAAGASARAVLTTRPADASAWRRRGRNCVTIVGEAAATTHRVLSRSPGTGLPSPRFLDR